MLGLHLHLQTYEVAVLHCTCICHALLTIHPEDKTNVEFVLPCRGVKLPLQLQQAIEAKLQSEQESQRMVRAALVLDIYTQYILISPFFAVLPFFSLSEQESFRMVRAAQTFGREIYAQIYKNCIAKHDRCSPCFGVTCIG